MQGQALSPEALSVIAEALSAPATPDDCFSMLTERAATALGARAAIVVHITDESGTRLRPLAAYRDGASIVVPTFHTSGTPFETVIGGAPSLVGHETADGFALPAVLANGTRWLLGVPISDSGGSIIGALAVLFSDQHPPAGGAETALRMLAARAGLEIARERAERALQDTELRYRMLVEDSFDLVAELDGDRYTYVSPGYETVLEYAPDAMLGMTAVEFVHPDDRAELLAEGQRMIRERASGRFRVRMRHRDGSWRVLESAGRSFKSADGSIRTVVFTKDASAQQEAEEARRGAEELLRATLDSTFDGLMVTRIGERMLYWNRKIVEMFAVPDEILESRSVPELVAFIGTRMENPEEFLRTLATLPVDAPAHIGVMRGVEGRRFDVYTQPLQGPDATTRRVWSIREVTEESAVSAALEASEERFRSLTSAAPIGIYVTDTAGLCVYTNRRWQEMAGMSATDALGEGWAQGIHPEDAPEVFAGWEASVAEQREISMEFRFQRPDGSVRWVRTHATVTRDENGDATGYVGTNEDVTEQRQAEDALRASEARLRTIVNNAPIVLFALDAEERFVMSEGKGLAELGLAPNEIVGRTITDFYGERTDIIEGMRRTLAGEQYDAIVKGGGRTYDAHYSPERDAEGNVTGILGVAIDITDQSAMNDALRRSQETAQALLNAPMESAILVDDAGTILMLNNMARERLREHAARIGHADDDFAGVCIFDLFPEDVRAQRRARNDQVFRTGAPARYEEQRDGVWTDTTVDPIYGESGTVDRVAIFTRDVTDRKRAEDELRDHALELEILNQHLAEASDSLARSQEELNEKSDQLEQLLDTERDRARTDPLTGALNHGAVNEALKELFAADTSEFAIAMVDVDGMKAANDTYGHQAGDMVLHAVTAAITQRGAITGRYGGDEFLVVLPYADAEAAEEYKQTVAAALSDARVTDPETGATIAVVASVGIAVFPGDGTTPVQLVEAADDRMYNEKRARRASHAPSLAPLRSGADERSVRMVGELVPLLTSPGTLDERLRLVSHRLTAEAGYDGVNFDIFVDAEEQREGENGIANQNAFVKASDELVEAWNDEQRTVANHPIGQILEETRQPVILDDLATDPRLTETQRTLLSTIGLVSGIAVPMLHRDVAIGTLSAGSKQAGFFTPREAAYLMAVASQIAAIIHMARIVEEHAADHDQQAA